MLIIQKINAAADPIVIGDLLPECLYDEVEFAPSDSVPEANKSLEFVQIVQAGLSLGLDFFLSHRSKKPFPGLFLYVDIKNDCELRSAIMTCQRLASDNFEEINFEIVSTLYSIYEILGREKGCPEKFEPVLDFLEQTRIDKDFPIVL